MLNQMHHIPDDFLNAKAEDLLDILKAPTLFHLEGVNPQPLFICTLLHGDETTGLYAVQRLLKKYRNEPLPRAISLFIGNIAAARENQRRLDSQDDYNRIWPGSHHSDSAEKDMMQTVTNIMRKKNHSPASIYITTRGKTRIMAVSISSTLMAWCWLLHSATSLFISPTPRVFSPRLFQISAPLSYSSAARLATDLVRTMRCHISRTYCRWIACHRETATT